MSAVTFSQLRMNKGSVGNNLHCPQKLKLSCLVELSLLRNVLFCPFLTQALQEAHRVLKPGGRFLCLEFSQVNNPLVSRLVLLTGLDSHCVAKGSYSKVYRVASKQEA